MKGQESIPDPDAVFIVGTDRTGFWCDECKVIKNDGLMARLEVVLIGGEISTLAGIRAQVRHLVCWHKAPMNILMDPRVLAGLLNNRDKGGG